MHNGDYSNLSVSSVYRTVRYAGAVPAHPVRLYGETL